jgi:hypothetical protein
MVYFSRLNTNNINPLVAEALKVNKKLHEEDIYSCNSDKYFSRPILDFSLLYKNNFDSSRV